MSEKFNYFFSIEENDEIVTKVVIAFKDKPKDSFLRMLDESNCVVVNKSSFKK